MGYRIVVAQPIEQEIIDDLERLGPVHMNPGPEPLSPEALAAAAAEAEALMAFMTERVDRALLEACPNLKIVAGAFKG
ncbi:MAG: hydroxyacid dehydrogenase, partial [Pseudomonadota bacterium]